jgi:hypothetical protein
MSQTRVRADMPGIVLRLDLEAERVGGSLNGLRLQFPGLEEIPAFWRWVRVDVYAVSVQDDEIDPGSVPIGTALLSEGVVQLDNLGFAFQALSQHRLLIEMSVIRPEAAGAWIQLTDLLPYAMLAALALALLVVAGRRRLQWAAAVLLLASLIGFTPACSRYGFMKNYFDTRAVLADDSDVSVSYHPDDTLTVKMDPIEGDQFTLDMSR